MDRYNIFQQLHKALQGLLFDTAILLQQTDFGRASEAAIALDKLNTLLHLFTQHAALKEKHLLPAIQNVEPGVAFALAQQQGPQFVCIQRLQGLITMYDHAISTDDKREAGRSINQAYTGGVINLLRYMHGEEQITSSTLWRYYTDAEILGMEQEIVADISTEDISLYSEWMIRSMNNQEITQWLKTVERTAEGPMFQSVFAFAENELSLPRWQKVQDGLTEGMLIA
jgi:hypothetical protein